MFRDVNHNLNTTVTAVIPISADPPKRTSILAKVDSGASNHYSKPQDQHVLSKVHATPFGPTVVLPGSKHIQATHSGQLPLHLSFSGKAKKAHSLDGITNSSLISIGQLRDDDCVTILDNTKIEVFKNDTCVLSGKRNATDGIWDIPIPITSARANNPPVTQQVNAITHKDQTKTAFTQYLYGCCGSPGVST
jgi:hypothetical protein